MKENQITEGGKTAVEKVDFLEKYDLTEDDLQDAQVSWEELVSIYEDFLSKQDRYDEIRERFIDEYLSGSAIKNYLDAMGDDAEPIAIHSVRSRLKDPEHLMEKVVRKRKSKDSKYRQMTGKNYEKFVTDLIGIRCLVVLKSDWCAVHKYLTDVISDDARMYVKDCLADFRADETVYHAEAPKVHIRNGDSRELYESLVDPGYVEDGKIYRSAHYIIKYSGVYLEVQVRTLFEESWGEVDHQIVYPPRRKKPDDGPNLLEEYSALLNRIAGLGDEMGAFFHELKTVAGANRTEGSSTTTVDSGLSERGVTAGSPKADDLHDDSRLGRQCELDNQPGLVTVANCIEKTISAEGKATGKGVHKE